MLFGVSCLFTAASAWTRHKTREHGKQQECAEREREERDTHREAGKGNKCDKVIQIHSISSPAIKPTHLLMSAISGKSCSEKKKRQIKYVFPKKLSRDVQPCVCESLLLRCSGTLAPVLLPSALPSLSLFSLPLSPGDNRAAHKSPPPTKAPLPLLSPSLSLSLSNPPRSLSL